MKISIIIPAYNAEKQIRKCVLSALQQDISHNEYEIIVINDGSTDQTAGIIQELSREYPTIKSITTTNQGVSAARNLGMDIAQGEIILFADADDYFCTNSIAKIYEAILKNDLDILLFDYNHWGNQNTLLKGFDYDARKFCPRGIVSGKSFIKTGYMPAAVWMLAYRREYMLKMNFKFINIRHEDEEFIPRVFYFAEKIMHLPLICYNYVQNESSFMQNYKEYGLFDKIKAMDNLNQFTQKYVKEEDVAFTLSEHISLRLMENLNNSFAIKSKAQGKMVKQMKKAGLTPLVHTKREGRYAFLYKYFPVLFIAYYRHKYLKRHHSK